MPDSNDLKGASFPLGAVLACLLAVAGLVGCSPDRPETSPLEAASQQLALGLSGQSPLIQELVADGEVSQADQDLAVDALFACYAQAGVSPSEPVWNGERYEWTVALNTADEGVSQQRTEAMLACEQVNWDYLQSYIAIANSPSEQEFQVTEQQVADCITAAGLDGAGYLAGSSEVLATPEAANCYREVYGG